MIAPSPLVGQLFRVLPAAAVAAFQAGRLAAVAERMGVKLPFPDAFVSENVNKPGSIAFFGQCR